MTGILSVSASRSTSWGKCQWVWFVGLSHCKCPNQVMSKGAIELGFEWPLRSVSISSSMVNVQRSQSAKFAFHDKHPPCC